MTTAKVLSIKNGKEHHISRTLLVCLFDRPHCRPATLEFRVAKVPHCSKCWHFCDGMEFNGKIFFGNLISSVCHSTIGVGWMQTKNKRHQPQRAREAKTKTSTPNTNRTRMYCLVSNFLPHSTSIEFSEQVSVWFWFLISVSPPATCVLLSARVNLLLQNARGKFCEARTFHMLWFMARLNSIKNLFESITLESAL